MPAMTRIGSLVAALVSFLTGSGLAQSTFVERTAAAGIDFVTVSGELDKRHILSTLGSGVALIDYDEDGDLDLYFVNGARIVDGGVDSTPSDRLYRNDGGWAFTDVSEQARIARPGWGVGVSVGDIDNDGLSDLYVTRVGENLLFRNRGDGTFEEVAGPAGVAHAAWGTSSVWFDADGDGDLDLYVANYIEVDLDALPRAGEEERCQWFGISIMCGPKGLPGQPDVFFVNDGDGTFSDRTVSSGLSDPSGAYGLGVVAGDLDGDGHQDLYVANDSVPNFFYRNSGDGTFREAAFLSGVALSTEGLAQAGMGVDLGDLNADGALDLFVTNFSHETNNAYMNHGEGLFLDAVGEANMHGPSWFSLGWGTRMVDFDHDGDLDVFVANGHVYPGVDETNLKTLYHQPNQIFWNDGAGLFHESPPAESDAMARASSSRAAAFGDLDGDGDIDGVVVNIDREPSLLDNRPAEASAWIGLRLIGRSAPRDAAGTVVSLHASVGRLVRIVHTGGSFLAASDARLDFGLGDGGTVEGIEVHWASGAIDTVGSVLPGRLYVVIEGQGLLTQ